MTFLLPPGIKGVKKGSTSGAIFKSILHVVQNVWHGHGHGHGHGLTECNSAYFWVISWTLNYTLKTGWT